MSPRATAVSTPRATSPFRAAPSPWAKSAARSLTRSIKPGPEPDIAIVQLPESNYFERYPLATDIDWIVEVAKSSLKTDRDSKVDIYAIAGIPEYWLLDLAGQCLTVFRTPLADHYTEEQRFQSGAIAPLAFPNVTISVERLLLQAQT
jgi:Uma2 family endonuclease